ncbi:MAG: hypothetical protein ABI851_12150 [Saprospiraceae bacterium]
MISIRIFDGPSYWMNHYADADGAVYLDLSDDTNFQLSKQSEQLTSLDKITIEGALGTSLPATPRNVNLIGKPTDIAVKDNQYSDYAVQIKIGMKILTQTTLRVNSKKDNVNSELFEIEFLDTSHHWAVQLDKVYLDELPLPDIEYSGTKMMDSIKLNAKFDDGDPGYWWPLVHHNYWVSNDFYTISDFRPWFHCLKIIRESFHKVGWQISCPILETEIGRRLISYINAKEFYTEKAKVNGINEFKAGLKNQLELPKPEGANRIEGILIFDNEIKDTSGYYNPSTGEFSGIGYYNFVVQVKGNAFLRNSHAGGARAFIYIQLIHKHADGTLERIDERQESGTKNQVSIDWTIEANILLKTGESVFVKWFIQGTKGTTGYFTTDSFFYNEILNYIPIEGAILKTSELLRHDKCLDYLKGISHLFNLKFYTNYAERKVYALTPYDQTFFGDSVTGYFIEDLINLNSNVDFNTIEINVTHEDDKNVFYNFKPDSSDIPIKNLELKEFADLYSKFIDKGKDKKDNTEKKENPYFSPTLNKLVQDGNIKRFPIDMPLCIDNNDNSLSFGIEPRILIAAGYELQLDPDFEINADVTYNFPTTYTDQRTPYAFQVPNAYTIGVVNGSGTGFDFSKPTSYLIYGDKEFDLFNLFYKRHLKEFGYPQSAKINIFLNYNLFDSIYFRNRYLVDINGTNQVGRLLSIDGYNLESMKGVALFKAQNSNDPDCGVVIVGPECKNYPAILVTPTGGGNYTISASGSNGSTIASTLIEWRYIDEPDTWHTGSTFTTTNRIVISRITWDYDGDCVSIQKVAETAPCSNYPKICIQKVIAENPYLSITDCGVHSETPTAFLYEFSSNNGITWQQVPEPWLLTEIPESIQIRLTSYYTNCPEKSVIDYYTNEISDEDCNYDGPEVPSVKCIVTPAGLILERVGSFIGTAALDYIKFRLQGQDGDWDIYDDINQEILSTENGVKWEAQRIVIFCNNGCPIYCGDIVKFNTSACSNEISMIQSSVACLHTLKWEHPDTHDNFWKVGITNDRTYVTPIIHGYLEEAASGPPVQLFSRTIQWASWNFKTECSFTWQEGHTIKLLKISKNVAGTQTLTQNLDLAILFTSGDTNADLTNSVINTITTQMLVQYNALIGDNYDLVVSIIGSGASRTTKIAFLAKKVVASTWFGFKKGTDYVQTATPGNVTTNYIAVGSEFQKVATAAPRFIITTPNNVLMDVRLKVNVSTQFINDASSDFDNIVVNTSVAIVSEVLTVFEDNCNKYDMSVDVGTCTSPTYIWKRGARVLGFDPTFIHYGKRRVRVIVTCANGCSYMADYQEPA